MAHRTREEVARSIEKTRRRIEDVQRGDFRLVEKTLSEIFGPASRELTGWNALLIYHARDYAGSLDEIPPPPRDRVVSFLQGIARGLEEEREDWETTGTTHSPHHPDHARSRALAATIRELLGDLRGLVQQPVNELPLPEVAAAYERVKAWDERAYAQLERVGCRDVAQQLRAVSLEALPSTNDEIRDMLREGLVKRTTSLRRAEQDLHPPLVFVGHGGHPLWNRVMRYLKDELRLPAEDWESHSRVGLVNVEVLKDLLDRATFAVIVVTAEDIGADDQVRARQNVVHEIGLFQGRLDFKKVALLQQEGVEAFSNLAGLQTIRFSGDNITATFYELQRMLVREGVLPESRG